MSNASNGLTIKLTSLNLFPSIRLVLNYKRIPYRTEWVSYPDIASTFEKRGIPPSEALENGKPYYTCPAIIDLNGKPEPWKVSDSMTIAEYLEDTYSDPECGPKLFPEGTKEAQLAFIRHLKSETIPRAWRLVVTLVPAILDSRGREYYCSTREETVGAPLAEFGAAGTTQREEFSTDLKEAMDDVAAMYDRNEEGGGECFTRETITYADVFLVSNFLWMRRVHRIGMDRMSSRRGTS